MKQIWQTLLPVLTDMYTSLYISTRGDVPDGCPYLMVKSIAVGLNLVN